MNKNIIAGTKRKSFFLAIITLFSLSLPGCSSNKQETVDETKSQLKVYSFTGGFGRKWLDNLKSQYEEKVKDTSFEEGKKGVQINITAIKQDVLRTEIPNSGYDVLFLEQHDFYADVNSNCYADITDLVTQPNKYDNGTTIESRLSDSQKAMFNVDGKYYALPHYTTSVGFLYNIDLFKEKNYYLAKTPAEVDGVSEASYFINDNNPTKSDGPDGIAGTEDDGLPATYEEFFLLCDWIKNNGDTPVTFGEDVFGSYLSFLINSLAVDYMGYDQAMLSYTFDGEASTLATIDSSSKLVMDSEHTIVTPTNKNGKELRRSAGYYYGLSFENRLISSYKSKSEPGYLSENCFSGSNYLTAQKEFVQDNDIAMLVDGMWAENEADEVANAFRKGGSRQERNIGFMPLPKADQNHVGKPQTLFDIYFPECFVNASSNQVSQSIAKDFLSYAYSNEGLTTFTKATGALKSVKYTISDEDMKSMNTYAKSMAKLKNSEADGKVNFVYPLGNSSIYKTNHSYFDIIYGEGLGAKINNVNQSSPSNWMRQNPGSNAPATYFTGMYALSASESFFR